MNSKYSIEIKESYLYFTVSGEYNFTDFMNYLKIVKHECEKAKIYRVIFDALNVTKTDISVMDRYFLGEKIAKIMRSKIKLAVVWPEKDISKFAETVALNRGGNIYVIGEIESAIEWILGDN